MLHELQTIGIGTLSQVAKKPVVLIGETSPSIWAIVPGAQKLANSWPWRKLSTHRSFRFPANLYQRSVLGAQKWHSCVLSEGRRRAAPSVHYHVV